VCMCLSFQKDHSGKRAVTCEVRVGVSSLFSTNGREEQMLCVCVCVCVSGGQVSIREYSTIDVTSLQNTVIENK